MTRREFEKVELPVSKIRRYLEPGPIVLATGGSSDAHNIMTMGLYTARTRHVAAER